MKITKAISSTDSCWTDHRLVLSQLSFRLQPKQRLTKRKPRGQYRVNLLHQAETKTEFQAMIDDKLTEIIEGQDVDTV